jgi:hypothetical protein
VKFNLRRKIAVEEFLEVAELGGGGRDESHPNIFDVLLLQGDDERVELVFRHNHHWTKFCCKNGEYHLTVVAEVNQHFHSMKDDLSRKCSDAEFAAAVKGQTVSRTTHSIILSDKRKP